MTIKQKLFILTLLPTFALLFFSISHITDKYRTYNAQEILLISSTFINNSANILHQLQLERELSSSYLNTSIKNNKYFKNLLLKQQKVTNATINKFNFFLKQLNKKNIHIANSDFINRLNISLKSLMEIRKTISENTITSKKSFSLFSHINSQLLDLVESIKYYSDNEKTQSNILILKKLLVYQEHNARERGFLLQINEQLLSPENLEKLTNAWRLQDNIYASIKTLSHNQVINKKIDTIDAKRSYTYIMKTRKLITNSVNKSLSIDSKIWLDMTTDRINDYHTLREYIFSQIESDIKKRDRELYNSFIYQIFFTTIALFSLLFGTMFISRSIDKSLKKLDNGMDNFFNFLNFKSDAPQNINIVSKDELGIISSKINTQILYIQKRLKNDKEFINETTRIVTMMKDGNFSEKFYFEPSNPNLKKLKLVFDELIKLISNKIAEQTLSLEELNISLENKVYEQTIKLKRQIVKITDARDAAIKAEMTKDEFLANMSHEIRTPLNAILGFVTILNKHIENKKHLEYLNIIDSSGKSLLAIINDILDFSKIKSGKLTITNHNINPLKEFGDTTQLFASKAYEKHLSYAVYIDPNLPNIISIDDTRVKQVLSNLLSNAIKFTPQDGTIKVKIYTNNNLLIISVQDSGIGIPKRSQKNIFNAFSQADSSTTKKYGGTGLGLSISSLITKLMYGSLTLSSKESIGSTFTLKVPVNIIDNSVQNLINSTKTSKYKIALLNINSESNIFVKLIKKYLNDFGIINIIELDSFSKDGYDILFFLPDDSYNEEIVLSKNIKAIAMLKSDTLSLADFSHITSLYAPFTPLAIVQALNDITDEDIKNSKIETEKLIEVKFIGNILIAEDNKTNQMLISLMMDDYGINYEIAKNGKIAVEMFKNAKFDLVLMDENMPELNGLGAMKQIKKYETKNNLECTPIVALTANAMITDVKMFLNAGMDGFIAKPIDSKLLEAELSKFLKKV